MLTTLRVTVQRFLWAPVDRAWPSSLVLGWSGAPASRCPQCSGTCSQALLLDPGTLPGKRSVLIAASSQVTPTAGPSAGLCGALLRGEARPHRTAGPPAGPLASGRPASRPQELWLPGGPWRVSYGHVSAWQTRGSQSWVGLAQFFLWFGCDSSRAQSKMGVPLHVCRHSCPPPRQDQAGWAPQIRPATASWDWELVSSCCPRPAALRLIPAQFPDTTAQL